MVSNCSLSQLYVRLVVVALFCSSCLAPGRLEHSASEPVVENASVRQSVAQTVTAPASSQNTKMTRVQQDMYGKLPLSFEANQGQTDAQVKFLSRGPGYALFLTATEAVLTLQKNADRGMQNGEGKNHHSSLTSSSSSLGPPTIVRMQVVGANPAPHVTGAEQLLGKVNYMRGSDPALWRTNIPTYRTVQYQDVYPGIDLVYYGKQRQLEYDFIVAPGTDPSTIRLTFTDAAGKPLPQTFDTQGHLILHTSAGEVQLHKPFIYQDIDGIRTEVAGSYAPQDLSVGFQVASYDKSKPLVIDPKLIVYSSFLGGDRSDSAFALALDNDHNVYLAGQTLSANFPIISGVVDTTSDVDRGDAFVAKLNIPGTELLYATYLGGPGADVAKSIAVDGFGNTYIAGETLAPDKLTPVFPTTPDAVQPIAGGGLSDAFVAKLDPTGSKLVYSTYLGGKAYDRANGIAIEKDCDALVGCNAYVVGQTLSDLFPLDPGTRIFGPGPLAPNNPATLPHDAFVVKLNDTGTTREYITVFSARAFEDATAIAVNDDGEAYVVGFTSSFDFPVTSNALQPNYSPTDGTSDAFVAKLDATGTILEYSTYLGGDPGEPSDPSSDAAFGVTIDPNGHAVVSGVTGRSETQDAFISIIDVNDTGESLFSTFLGGNNILTAGAVAVDSPLDDGSYNIYVAGTTSSTIPTTTCAVQPIYGGGPSDAFIAKIKINSDSTGESELQYATYLGGSEKDEAYGFAVDEDRNMYIAGLTQSPSFFTTAGSVQPGFGGIEDAFVTKFDVLSHAPCADLRLTMTDAPDPVTVGNNVTYSLAVNNLGPDFATNVTVTDTLPSGMTLVSATPSTGACVGATDVSVGTTNITCSLGTMTLTQTDTVTIVAQATAAGTPINNASVTASGPDFDENNNIAAANTSVVGGNQLLVTVSNAAGASGQVKSHPEGIACPPDCSEAFPPGTKVNLTAEPDVATSSFGRWDGACSAAGATPFCPVTVDGDLAVEASFATATGLKADWVDLTQTCRTKGKQQRLRCRVTGTLRVLNLGPVRSGKNVTRFFFSDDPTLNAGYVVLKTKKVPALDVGGERLIHIDASLPSGVNGSGKYVVAYVDANEQVAEGNEADNRAVSNPLP